MIPRWFAAKTKAGQDRVAVEHLRRQNFETYYPLIYIKRRSLRGRITQHCEGLFPGYVLVQFVLEVASWRVINSTRGVQRLLSFADDGRPSALAIGEIERIKAEEKAGKLRFSEISEFRKDDQVKVKFGVHVDVAGRVLRTRGERIELLLSLMGHNVRCIAPSHALDLVGRQRNTSVR